MECHQYYYRPLPLALDIVIISVAIESFIITVMVSKWLWPVVNEVLYEYFSIFVKMSFIVNFSRFLYGSLFLLGGAVKTKAFGMAFASLLYGYMTEAFEAAHDVLSMERIVSAVRFQEMIGYTEMLCGFMLLSGQLVALGSAILMLICLGAVYALNALEQSFLTQAGVFMLFWGLLLFTIELLIKPRSLVAR